MKEMFCDDPTYIYATLVIIEIILVCVWLVRKDLITGLLLIVPLVAGVGVWTIDALVETDREIIEKTSYNIAAELSKGNIKPMLDVLDEKYFGYGEHKEQAQYFAESQIKKYNISSCTLSDMNVVVNGMRAEQDVTSSLTWGDNGGKNFLRWHIYWVKRPAGWKVEKADQPKQTIPGFGG